MRCDPSRRLTPSRLTPAGKQKEARGTRGNLASFRRFPSSHRADAYCRVNLTVTVMRTDTGTPFSRVGVYSHCRTASSAA